tara:strand:- start:53 stop:682 length:630 start_codon:yes stop_codon:yes gene_type:complete
MIKEVTEQIERNQKWQPELIKLRQILLDCDLIEVLKWKQPCYTYKNKNIAMIGSFKEFIALSFFKGALLKGGASILVQQGENTRSARIAKLTTLSEIDKLQDVLKALIFEAIEVEKTGVKLAPADKKFSLCAELEEKFTADNEFKVAFNKLTPGRQRGYNLFFSTAKQSATRLQRIEKFRERILMGYGMNDCTCGKSNRMPNCDGSHKN